jgi:hypothetical protein
MRGYRLRSVRLSWNGRKMDGKKMFRTVASAEDFLSPIFCRFVLMMVVVGRPETQAGRWRFRGADDVGRHRHFELLSGSGPGWYNNAVVRPFASLGLGGRDAFGATPVRRLAAVMARGLDASMPTATDASPPVPPQSTFAALKKSRAFAVILIAILLAAIVLSVRYTPAR